MHTPSEVRDLDLSMDSHKNVLRLDVPVHDMLVMEIRQRCGHLRDVLCCFPLWKSVFFPKMFIQLSFARKFEHEEDTLDVVKVAVEANDIGMSQMAVDLNLSPHLLFDLSLLQLAFVKDFQCANKPSRSLFGQVYATEFALAQGLSYFEHTKVELLRLWLLINWRIRQSLYGAFV